MLSELVVWTELPLESQLRSSGACSEDALWEIGVTGSHPEGVGASGKRDKCSRARTNRGSNSNSSSSSSNSNSKMRVQHKNMLQLQSQHQRTGNPPKTEKRAAERTVAQAIPAAEQAAAAAATAGPSAAQAAAAEVPVLH
ncbi:hypothetical protein ACSSS7_002378 [Eimeria intestinalis]